MRISDTVLSDTCCSFWGVCWGSVLTPVLTTCLAGLADMLALGVKLCLRAALSKPEERLKASMIPSADLSAGESVSASAAVFSSTLLDSDPVTLLFICQVLFIIWACRTALNAFLNWYTHSGAALIPPVFKLLLQCLSGSGWTQLCHTHDVKSRLSKDSTSESITSL